MNMNRKVVILKRKIWENRSSLLDMIINIQVKVLWIHNMKFKEHILAELQI